MRWEVGITATAATVAVVLSATLWWRLQSPTASTTEEEDETRSGTETAILSPPPKESDSSTLSKVTHTQPQSHPTDIDPTKMREDAKKSFLTPKLPEGTTPSPRSPQQRHAAVKAIRQTTSQNTTIQHVHDIPDFTIELDDSDNDMF